MEARPHTIVIAFFSYINTHMVAETEEDKNCSYKENFPQLWSEGFLQSLHTHFKVLPGSPPPFFFFLLWLETSTLGIITQFYNLVPHCQKNKFQSLPTNNSLLNTNSKNKSLTSTYQEVDSCTGTKECTKANYGVHNLLFLEAKRLLVQTLMTQVLMREEQKNLFIHPF